MHPIWMQYREVQIMLLIARCVRLTNDAAIISEFYLPQCMFLILLWGLFCTTLVISGVPFPRHSLLPKRFSGLSEQRKVSQARRMGRAQKANKGERGAMDWKRTLTLPSLPVPFSFSFSSEPHMKTNEKGCFAGHPCFILLLLLLFSKTMILFWIVREK